MAHFLLKSRRASLEEVQLAVGQTLEVTVSGMVPELTVVSAQPDVLQAGPTDPRTGRAVLTAKAPGRAGPVEVQLKHAGGAVWDYFLAGVSATPGTPPGWAVVNDYKRTDGRKLRLSVFWHQSVGYDPFPHYAQAAEMVLARHGLGLDVQPGTRRTPDRTLPPDRDLNAASELVDLIDKAVKSPGYDPARLTVIVWAVGANLSHDRGVAYTAKTWDELALGGRPTLVTLNANALSHRGLTLLHEMGHAAGLEHETPSPGAVIDNFMNDNGLTNRESVGTGMTRRQLDELAKSFFGLPR